MRAMYISAVGADRVSRLIIAGSVEVRDTTGTTATRIAVVANVPTKMRFAIFVTVAEPYRTACPHLSGAKITR